MSAIEGEGCPLSRVGCLLSRGGASAIEERGVRYRGERCPL